MEITLAPFVEEDSEGLWLLEKIWDETNTPVPLNTEDYEAFKKKLADQQLLVAHKGQEVVGSLSYQVIDTIPSRNKQWIFGIAVSPAAQGQGVGRLLIEELFRLARKAGVAKLSLRVMATNPGTITFYKKMGFEQEAHYKKEFWINDTWVDDFQFAYYL
ncbi:MAG TPA: GNAT family N-acetyltransferase [Enterococcus sp.]|nr:GNAT family N-acetyltransferase [Enterococcus sp.]HPR81402.1 GNAT family N-acetyltransferase [Enterococcus sp.]